MKAIANSHYGFLKAMTCLYNRETLMSTGDGAVTLSCDWAGTENQMRFPG